MSTSLVQRTRAFFSKRRLGVAAVAAIIGCAACCAIPLLAAAGLSSGAVAILSKIFRPGSELLVGGTVFAVVLVVTAVRNRLSPRSTCGPACKVDGTCCDAGATTRTA